MDGLFYFLVYLPVCVHWKVGENFVCLIADRLTACVGPKVSHEPQVPEYDLVVRLRGLGCVLGNL